MKVDIGLVFKYILAIIIPLIVYFGIGWIAKDIYFSIWEIVDSTTLEEIYNKEILVYACVAVGYIILCHIILDDNSPVGGMVFAGAFPVVVGSYRREIMVPADWKGKDIIAHFGTVM